MNVHSIFQSISGEAGFFPQGSWCTFIRLQGCNLRCRYCDTEDAQDVDQGIIMCVDDIIRECKTKQVLVTGGEPLFQSDTRILLSELVRCGFHVQVETNGSLRIEVDMPSVGWVVDRKGPSSGMEHMMEDQQWTTDWMRFVPKTIVKYVVDPDRIHGFPEHGDMEFMLLDMLYLRRKGYGGKFIISPMNADANSIPKIVNFLKQHDNYSQIEWRNEVIFSLQLHKVIDMP